MGGDERVVLLGTGGATPYRGRANASVAIVNGDQVVVCDAGSGTCERLDQAGINVAGTTAICLSHLHADHCVELPILILSAFLAGRVEPITILGPVGTADYVQLTMGRLYGYIPKLIEAVMNVNPDIQVIELADGFAYEGHGYRLTCASVVHGVPSLAFRYDSPERSVVVSGDTEKCAAVVDLSRGAEVLIHECPFPPVMGSIPGHTTAREVGEVAAAADVRQVILTHLFQETLGHENSMTDEVRLAFSGRVIVGHDGLEVHKDDR